MDQYQTPEQKLASFLTPKPIIDGHSLDMKVQGTEIYNHLTIYQEKFAKKFANMTDFIDKMKPLDERMSTIKLDMRSATTEPNVKDRSIVSGNDAGNDSEQGVPGVTYVRKISDTNNGYQCDQARYDEIKSIIQALGNEFGLDESEAIQLFVLRMGLGKFGWQNSDGEFCWVDFCGEFAIGPVDGNGDVPCLSFIGESGGFKKRSSKYALPQLSN